MIFLKSSFALFLLVLIIIGFSIIYWSMWKGGYLTSDELLKSEATSFAESCGVQDFAIDTIDEEVSGAPNYFFIFDKEDVDQKRSCLNTKFRERFDRPKEYFEVVKDPERLRYAR